MGKSKEIPEYICPKCDSTNAKRVDWVDTWYGPDIYYTDYKCPDCNYEESGTQIGLFNPWTMIGRNAYKEFQRKKELERRAPSLQEENRNLKKEIKTLKKQIVILQREFGKAQQSGSNFDH